MQLTAAHGNDNTGLHGYSMAFPGQNRGPGGGESVGEKIYIPLRVSTKFKKGYAHLYAYPHKYTHSVHSPSSPIYAQRYAQ